MDAEGDERAGADSCRIGTMVAERIVVRCERASGWIRSNDMHADQSKVQRMLELRHLSVQNYEEEVNGLALHRFT